MTTNKISLLTVNEHEAALVRFLWDADDVISSMECAMATLLEDGASLEVAEQLYYLSYRLREGADAVERKEMAQLARVIENIFEHARRGQVDMSTDLVSLLIPTCGALRRLMSAGAGAEETVAEREETPESDVMAVAAAGSF
jgi:chemotaxis protein histidine kinase CheA